MISFFLTQRRKGAKTQRLYKNILSLLLCAFALISCSEHKPLKNNIVSNKPTHPLYSSALQAMRDRTGVIIVKDLQSGKLLVYLTNGISVDEKFAPGSAIKPFTALAALRMGGAVNLNHKCKTRYTNGDFELTCSHKKINSAFNLEQAIAYSCNDYFGNVAEKLNRASFDTVLKEFGASPVDGDYSVSDALGESNRVAVSPTQLLNAYIDLLLAKNISSIQRELLINGMRGVVEYGTASGSGLKELKQYVFGKTGTSTGRDARYNQGWFVGVVNESQVVHAPPKLAILVFLKNSNGAEAARAAASVLYDWGSLVKVRSVREGVTRQLPMDEYIAGVVTGEAGHMTHLEALKAQSVVARTFAVKNRDRHADEGYDFCSTTHCQRFISGNVPQVVRNAVNSTHREILKDEKNQVADIYYHAACGGMTADKVVLWGGDASNALSSVQDEFCSSSRNNSWIQTISQSKLLSALRSDDRSDPGITFRSIQVQRRDATGRAEIVTIDGSRHRRLRGWDFTLIVNRNLGWNTLKSSRFEMFKSNSDYIFRGSGFGHGLGFCQEGGEQAARRGMGYKEILKHYFPKIKSFSLLADNADNKDVLTPNYQRLITQNFHISYSKEVNKQYVEDSLKILESARSEIVNRLKSSDVRLSGSEPFEIVIHGTTADFISVTGQSGLAAGVTSGRRIDLQPPGLLKKRGIFEPTLKHEFTHSVIEVLSKRQAPHWISEGLSIHVANEGGAYSRINIPQNLTRELLERRLRRPISVEETRQLYAASYREVKLMIDSRGEAYVWKMICR